MFNTYLASEVVNARAENFDQVKTYKSSAPSIISISCGEKTNPVVIEVSLSNRDEDNDAGASAGQIGQTGPTAPMGMKSVRKDYTLGGKVLAPLFVSPDTIEKDLSQAKELSELHQLKELQAIQNQKIEQLNKLEQMIAEKIGKQRETELCKVIKHDKRDRRDKRDKRDRHDKRDKRDKSHQHYQVDQVDQGRALKVIDLEIDSKKRKNSK